MVAVSADRAPLVEAIDRLLESNAALRKRRALAPVERRVTAAMSKAFRAQGRAFLTRLALVRGNFPRGGNGSTAQEAVYRSPGNGSAPREDCYRSPVREVAAPVPWEPAFDEAALATLQAFADPLDAAAAEALAAGGQAGIADLALDTAFDLEHPAAVDYLRRRGAERVTAISDTTRTRLRTLLTQAASDGWGYDRTGREIRRLYRDFSVTRARNIAVFELGSAYEAGNMLVARDLQDGGVPMEKSWLTVGDHKVRPDHRANQAQGWIPLDSSFQDGSDRPPADPGCLPGDCRVAAEGITATSERRYEGDLVVVFTASGKQLACTPNHPILTPHGWVGARLLDEGDDVISSSRREWMGLGDIHIDDMPATIKEVASAFRRTIHVRTVPVVAAPAFHGDGEGSKVAVIRSHGLLRDSRYTTIGEHRPQFGFVSRVGARLGLAGLGTCVGRLDGQRTPARRGVGLLDLALALLRRHLLPLQPLRFALAADRCAGLDQPAPHHRSGEAESLGDLILGDSSLVERHDLINGGVATIAAHGHAGLAESLEDQRLRDIKLARDLLDGAAGEVFADQIVRVDRVRFKGHVYNLETVTGAYVAGGIITHNCRCTLLMRRKPDG
jgi:hypothetical protein